MNVVTLLHFVGILPCLQIMTCIHLHVDTSYVKFSSKLMQVGKLGDIFLRGVQNVVTKVMDQEVKATGHTSRLL